MTEIRMTSARRAILDVLEHNNQHLTPSQIHDQLIERLPSLNLSTVYRSLDYLVEHSLISVADVGIGSPVYEKLDTVPHHHLVCLNCDEIFKLEHNLVTPFFKSLEKELKFFVETNHLVLYGTCKNCKE